MFEDLAIKHIQACQAKEKRDMTKYLYHKEIVMKLLSELSMFKFSKEIFSDSIDVNLDVGVNRVMSIYLAKDNLIIQTCDKSNGIFEFDTESLTSEETRRIIFNIFRHRLPYTDEFKKKVLEMSPAEDFIRKI